MSNRFPLQSNWGFRLPGWKSFSLSISHLCAKWGIVAILTTLISKILATDKPYPISVRGSMTLLAGKLRQKEAYRHTRRGQGPTAPICDTDSVSVSFPTIIKNSSVPPSVEMMGLLIYVAMFRTGPDALTIKSPHSHLCCVYIRPPPTTTPTDATTQLLIKF